MIMMVVVMVMVMVMMVMEMMMTNDDNLVEVCLLRGCEISLEFRVLLPSLIAGVLLTSWEIQCSTSECRKL